MLSDRYSGVHYSSVCFHIFYCNSTGLSNIVHYNGVFVIVGFVIAGCHCITGGRRNYYLINYCEILS